MDAVLVQLGTAILRALWELVLFPVWWYTRGLSRVARWASQTLRGWEHAVGLRLWLKALFVPMYGQNDLQGRLISFFMRFVVLIARMVQVAVGAVLVIVVLLVYLALPVAAVAQVVISLSR